MSAPGESRNPLEEPAAPNTPATQRTLFDDIFIGTDGVRAGWRAGLYASLVLVLMTAAQLALASTGISMTVKPRDMTPGPILLQELILFGSALLAAAALGLIEGRSVGDYGLPLRGAFRKHFWQGALWGFSEISVLVILIAAMGGYVLDGLMLSGGTALLSGTMWVAVFLMVGLAEEFAFRGYLLATLSSGVGFWPASILLSLGFGAVHLGNPGENVAGLVSIVAVGMLLCLTVRLTGDLWFAVGLHAAHDFGQAFVYSAPNSGTLIRERLFHASLTGPAWLTGGAAGPEGSFLELAVLGAMFVLFSSIYYSPPQPPEPRA